MMAASSVLFKFQAGDKGFNFRRFVGSTAVALAHIHIIANAKMRPSNLGFNRAQGDFLNSPPYYGTKEPPSQEGQGSVNRTLLPIKNLWSVDLSVHPQIRPFLID